MIDLFNAIVTFVGGTVFGSFLNVLVFRFPTHEDIVFTRSACPHCHKVLRWWELVPIISYVLLLGKCERCHARLSIQYPVVELILGLTALHFFTPMAATFVGILLACLYVAIVGLLIALALIDLRTFLLPDAHVVALGVLVIVLLALNKELQISALTGVLAGAGFLGLLWLLTRGRGIGLGDVKLMIPLGALFGPFGVTTLLFLAFTAGGVVGAGLLLRGKASMKTAIPFGPFLVVAALVLLYIPDVSVIFFRLLLG